MLTKMSDEMRRRIFLTDQELREREKRQAEAREASVRAGDHPLYDTLEERRGDR